MAKHGPFGWTGGSTSVREGKTVIRNDLDALEIESVLLPIFHQFIKVDYFESFLNLT